MANKINGVDGGQPASVGKSPVARGTQTPSSGGSSGVASADSVEITGTAGQLAVLEQSVVQLPAINEARVAAVQGAIDQGRYTISPETVADRLMQIEYALGTLQSKQSSR